MKSIKTYLLVFLSLIFLLLIYFSSSTNENQRSPEISINSISPFGDLFGKVVAASCGQSNQGHGSADEFTDCTQINCSGLIVTAPGKSQCGGACQPTDPLICSRFCIAGITPTPTYLNYQLIGPAGEYAYPSANGKPTPSYTTGSCTGTVPAGYERRCEVSRTTSDNTQTANWTENYDTNHTTWTNQPTKAYPYTENIKVRCGYFNIGANAYAVQSAWVQANAVIISPQYGLACTDTNACGVSASGTYDIYGVCNAHAPTVSTCSKTNACGQVSTGYQCPSGCTANTQNNNSCISNFRFTSDTVNPNGSVKFSWTLPNTVRSDCGFFDLTSPTPKPVPGLQNLDASTQAARITNIQITTRFCLICQFYSLLDGSSFGQAAVHQWIRVQKIGEN